MSAIGAAATIARLRSSGQKRSIVASALVAASISLFASDSNPLLSFLLLSSSSSSESDGADTAMSSEPPNFLFPRNSVRPSSAWRCKMSMRSTLVLCTLSILSKLCLNVAEIVFGSARVCNDGVNTDIMECAVGAHGVLNKATEYNMYLHCNLQVECLVLQ